MSKPQSPIHRPLEEADPPPPPTQSRIAKLAQLDSRLLAGTPRSLGPGGASAMFTQAVQRALVDEMAAQLRGLDTDESEIGDWAADIIAAFCEE